MKIGLLAGMVAITLMLGGCSVYEDLLCASHCASHTRSSSSLVAFLYPGGKTPPPANEVPQLSLPLRVGLAFLPSQTGYGSDGPSAAQKAELLERIRQRFSSRSFVSEITVIPDYYLAGSRGLEGLQGIQRLYNVDLVALVSYDQVASTDAMKYRSLAYLTIVGAFVVNGTEHEVSTLVDLAVIDPNTRALVLRAGGTDSRHASSAMVDEAGRARPTRSTSFTAATDAMIEHFDAALTGFESDVRAGRAAVHVVHRDGDGGGGASGPFDLAALLTLLAARALRCRRSGGWLRRCLNETARKP